MDDWNTSHHTASGLVQRVRTEGISTTEAEAVTLAFIEKHVEKGQAPLCGNTIWQDRRFLAALHAHAREFPALPDDRRQHREGTGAAMGAGRA